MTLWKDCKKVLCIRPDNMGDVLMSSPAIRALKHSFGCHITLLTSSMARDIARYIREIDEVLVWDVPWVKIEQDGAANDFFKIVEMIRSKRFDGAVIFTVFSQNPLPSALVATLAGIPLRLAYCRENPYQLLTTWVPDQEPYAMIRHQVRRDLELVKTIGADISDDRILIYPPETGEEKIKEKLAGARVAVDKPWLIVHPGVSEQKRQYPVASWIEAGRRIVNELGYQIVLTGTEKERALAELIKSGVGASSFNFAGTLSLEELIKLIQLTSLIVCVNTGPAHIAAALQKRVIVLYALTNPQHTPWKTPCVVLPFSVPEALESRNEVLRFVKRKCFRQENALVTPDDIVRAAHEMLVEQKKDFAPEVVVTLPLSSLYGMRNTLNFQDP